MMNKETNVLLQQLGQKIDVVSALLLRLIPDNSKPLPLQDQIKILMAFGMRPVDMAKIAGKTQNHINKELAAIRKKK